MTQIYEKMILDPWHIFRGRSIFLGLSPSHTFSTHFAFPIILYEVRILKSAPEIAPKLYNVTEKLA